MNRIISHSLKVASVIIFLIFTSPQFSFAQDGEALFKANCAACHKPDVDYVGPALKGVREKTPTKDWVYKWVRNATAMASTDPYAIKLKEAAGGVVMTSFPDMTNEEIDAILNYADSYKAPGAATGTPGATATAAKGSGSNNTVLYGLLTLILAIIAFVLLQVNSNLKKLTDEHDNIKSQQPVPFYRNKAYLLIVVFILFTLAGYFLVEGAMGLGRQQGYEPVQPIYYSHEVHAGVNQISCLYCHVDAQNGKHANIPSVNICMNCHKSVATYTVEPSSRMMGSPV